MTTFVITALLVLVLIYGFSGLRIISPLPIALKWKIGLWTIPVFCLGALILAVTVRYRIPGHAASPLLSWIAYTCFGFFTLIFPGLLLKDGCVAVYRIIKKAMVRNKKGNRTISRAAMNPSRRGFLVNAGNAAIAGVTVGLTGYGIARAVSGPDVVKVDIPIAGLPEPFHGFRILQISDLHISMTLKEPYVRAVVDRACQEQADMIAFTGDLADGFETYLGIEARPLADLTAKFGKYFVTGNHDYYSGAPQWLVRVKRLGFTPLINEHRIIEKDGAGIVLSGITDYRAGRIIPAHTSDPAKALKGVPLDMTKIMLAHQPKSIYQAAPHGVDLMICGHTHGGQYIPWNYMVPLDQPYVHGLHRHDNTLVYVNRGTGYWGPPMRIGAPPEITLLTLVAGSDKAAGPIKKNQV